MQAELVMIGTELLLGEVVDTNASFLGRGLAQCGVNLYRKSTVGDNWLRIIEVISQALGRSDIVIISGGMGPTDDDLTREAVAAAANCPLEENPQVVQELESWFRFRYGSHVEIPLNNRKQALFPKGAQIIPNKRGTAPGFILEVNSKVVIGLPGVPVELEAMFNETVIPYLQGRNGSHKLVTRNLNFVGIGESHLEELVYDVVANQTNPTVALYASQGQVRIRLTAKADSLEAGQALIDPVEEQIAQRTVDFMYGLDEETLEEVVGRQLSEQGSTVALAESCTGGLIGHRLTNVPGSSDYFMRGYVVYSNQAKMDCIGVKEATLRQFGAVSAETAQEMSEGVRRVSGTDYGLAVTGIAGPGGGTPEKPVGLVYISLAMDGNTKTEKHQFVGTREQIKLRASQAALRMLWLASRRQ